MKRACTTSLVVTVALATYGLACAQQPPDVVQSDSGGNTAMGSNALLNNNLAGSEENTAAGNFALLSNTTGSTNSALGYASLYYNTTGYGNTAVGAQALVGNTVGYQNTAAGYGALAQDHGGNQNTAVGWAALYGAPSLTGSNNTAIGFSALSNTTTGAFNTASGNNALGANTTGTNNTAAGAGAMNANVSGTANTAVGSNALGTNQGGSNNIAIGANAGYYIRGSLYNIDIGNVGNQQDVGLIRIGTSGQQSAAYIAGISGAHVTGSAVYVTSTGQLGVLASSERYKTAITPMGASTANLGQLRPVTFRLKTDAKRTIQYGLIAEEVAKVYPELVIRDGEGRIQGVRYEELAPMLLNEVQEQQKKASVQADQLRDMQKELSELRDLNRATRAALADLLARDGSAARR